MKDISITLDKGILRITLTAPERLNSITTDMVRTAHAALVDTEGVRVAVLSGEGRAFCSGAVISPDADNSEIMGPVVDLIRTIANAPFPIIAAVNGLAVGVGSSLALACDVQVASASGYFQQAFANVGLMGDGGAHALLAASVGRARAMRLLLEGEKVSNSDAHALGLISHCVPDDQWQQTVDTLVERFSSGPTLAYDRIKAAVNTAALAQLEAVFSLEAAGQPALGETADHQEALRAFAEKREARFTGR